MAEAAGLAVGAIALIGTFKDCIDLLAYISAARSFARDCEILNTKLDVEKTLLLQWAERVDLLKLPWDPRLDDLEARATIERILASVRQLLSESRELQQRYGLVSASNDNDVLASAPIISGPRMLRFIKDFEKLELDGHIDRQKLSRTKKMRWAIKDKQKFDLLIKDLSYFVSRLNAVIPEMPNSTISMTEVDLRALQSLAKLRTVLEASWAHEGIVARITKNTIKEHCEQLILNRLWYRRIDDRQDSITVPHYQTLEWALEPPHQDVEWDSLSDFLQFSSGIYWLSGKAGSGKSTLMKHIYNYQKTKELLLRWADKAFLTLASFFFWNLGTMDQKSQDGLLRALLYRVLDSNRSLIPELLPNMWRQASISDEQAIDPPSLAEMKHVFDRLGECQDISRKFCFFIDGLDEYEGNYMDGIAFIERLSKSPAIKIVLSSRPIPACVEAFSEKPKLQLQDLTKPDIEKYVYDTVESHSYMVELLDTDSVEALAILSDLVDKASGVFLWVVLACNSLLQGFASYDRISQLRCRVDELPPQLESLFQHMLNKIEPRYRDEASKLLRLCHQSQRMSGAEPLYSLGLALVDCHEMDVCRAPTFNSQTMGQKRRKCRIFEGRLRSRCCGLLEIKKAGAKEICFCDGTHDDFVDSTVSFIHRSVFEFLESPGVWNLSCLHIEDQMFDANAVLLCLSVHLVRLTSTWDDIERFFKDILLYCAAADRSEFDALVPVLYKFQELLYELANETYNTVLPDLIKNYRYSHTGAKLYMVLPLAVEIGMLNFVQIYESMNAHPLAGVIEPFPLLFHAIARPFSLNLVPSLQCQEERMVAQLLSAGCGPNKLFRTPSGEERTPWLCWLERMQEEIKQGKLDLATPSYALRVAQITESFLKSGANITFPPPFHDKTLDGLVGRLLDSDPVRGFLGDPSQRQERMLRRKDWEIVADKGRHLRDLVNERRLHLQRDQGILRRMHSQLDDESVPNHVRKRREP